MNSKQIWQAALGELQLQMHKVAFETWVKPAKVLSFKNDKFTIEVPDTATKNWIENKLLSSLKRSLSGIIGHDVTLTIIVQENGHDSAAAEDIPVEVELASFDPLRQGFVQTSNYAFRFWQPLIDVVPFSVWQTLRAFAYRVPREKPISKSIRPSIQTLADICTHGDRHKLLGRAARGGKFPREAQPGVLQELRAHRLLWMQIEGEESKTRYRFKVLDHLPLLTPTQVDMLTPHLQKAHERFIAASQIEREIWEGLTEPTLAPKVDDMVELLVAKNGSQTKKDKES